MYSMFLSTSEDLLKAAKELKRRKRDNDEYSTGEKAQLRAGSEMVDGTPAKLNRAYNDLVSRSNSLSWGFYKPEG